MSEQFGVGLDIGTMNIVAARQGSQGKNSITQIRDAFLDLPRESKKVLNMSKVPYVEMGDEILILGDKALQVANMFGKEARRPLAAGLVSSSETDALPVLYTLIESVLGKPKIEGEHCFFSVPAAPVDDLSKNVIYHTGIFTKIVSECGFTPHASNEAMAIIYAEAAPEGFSGVGISFGSGMTNVAMSLNAIEGFSFSVARGGDWIDFNSAQAIGATASKMCAVKESGIDLLAPKGREEESITFYYRHHIEYTLKKIADEFRSRAANVSIPNPIPLIVSGGTSRPVNFMALFEQEFDKARKRFPIPVSEIRQAKDPMNAVALGLLVQAKMED